MRDFYIFFMDNRLYLTESCIWIGILSATDWGYVEGLWSLNSENYHDRVM